MKNFYLLIALFFAACFVSCSNDDDDAPSSKKMELTQEQAYELVKKNLKGFSLKDIDIYVYPEVLPPNSEIERIVDDPLASPEVESWMFFVDEIPVYADWGHPCRYIFVDSHSHVLVVKDDIFPKNPSLGKWEMINISDATKNYNPSFITPEWPASTRAQVSSASMEHYYAVIHR